MAFTVLADGSIRTDTVDEAVTLALAFKARVAPAAPAPKAAPAVSPGGVMRNGEGFRWFASLDGAKVDGPTFKTPGEAEASLAAFRETGVMPPMEERAPPGAGSVYRSGRYGWKWRVLQNGKFTRSPTFATKQAANESLMDFVCDDGSVPPAPPRAPYRCSKCGAVGHTAKRHDAVVGWAQREAPLDDRPAVVDDPSPGAGSVTANRKGWRWRMIVDGKLIVGPTVADKAEAARGLEFARAQHRPGPPRRQCRTCQEFGHDRRTCPTLVVLQAPAPLEIVTLVAAQLPPAAAEDLPTPSPGRGELLADQRGGVGDEPAAPPPSTKATQVHRPHACSACGMVGHNARGHAAHAAAVVSLAAAPVPEPTFSPPPEVVSGPAPPSARTRVRCSVCDDPGHRKDRCPTIPREPAPARKGATPPREIEASPELGPIVVARGDRFVVVEDFVEEERGIDWVGAEVWTATVPAGIAHEGYQEWTLRRDDGAEMLGHPQLHPFLRMARRPDAEALARVRAGG